MIAPRHSTIRRFQQRAKSLEEQHSLKFLDDAILDLARWMDGAHQRLSDQDRAVLVEIGGVLYREGLRRRAGG